MKKNNGITLIALVITIVVLIILASVAITLSLGDNGIFKKAAKAKEDTLTAQNEESMQIAEIDKTISTTTREQNENNSTIFGIALTPGDGTQSNPYVITTKEQLQILSVLVNNGNTFNGKYFELNNDIELNYNRNWEPIGKEDGINRSTYEMIGTPNCFMGNFDGKNHTISGLNINNISSNYVGLFGVTYQASIKNLKISNENVTLNDDTCIATIVGYAINSTIENCRNYADVTTTTDTAGGIIGLAYNSIVKNCNNYGNIYGTSIGGIIGYVVGFNGKNTQIENCNNYRNNTN